MNRKDWFSGDVIPLLNHTWMLQTTKTLAFIKELTFTDDQLLKCMSQADK